MKELTEKQGNKENLQLDITLERNDICICDVIVTNNSKGVMQDARVLISDQPINQDKIEEQYNSIEQQNEVIEVSFDNLTRKYSFLAHPGFYYLLIFHANYYTQGENLKVEVDLIPVTQSIVKLRAFDIINQCNVQNADVVIKDTFDNILHYGKTNELGQIECRLKLSKTFRVSITKNQEFIHYLQTIEPSFNKILNDHYNIYMIPTNPTIQKQFEVLVYFPHKQFDIDFNIRCSDGSLINKFNLKQVFSSTCINYYDEIEFKDSKLIEFSIQNIKNNLNYDIEVFSKSCISEKKLEEYQNIQLFQNEEEEFIPHQKKKLFQKSAINMANYFMNSRISQEVKNSKQQKQLLEMPQTAFKVLPKPKKFDKDQSLKIFFIYKNQIQSFKEINTDIILQPTFIGSFISYSKMFTEYNPALQQKKQSLQENDENIQPIHTTKIPNQNLIQKLSLLDRENKENPPNPISPINIQQGEGKKQGQFLFSYNNLNNISN